MSNQDIGRALEDRTDVHTELMRRARRAQDDVFGDASVDRAVLILSIHDLTERLLAQLEALKKETT